MQQERFGSGPAGTPAGEVQGIACFEGCRQGRRVGGKALQQRQPQLGLLPAQGIEGIGTGGFLRKAPQQFCPEGLGFLGVSTRLGGEGRAFEADRRQHLVAAAVAPALALEPMAPILRAALGLSAQQQCRIPSPVWIEAVFAAAGQLGWAAVGGEWRSQLHQNLPPGGQGNARSQAAETKQCCAKKALASFSGTGALGQSSGITLRILGEMRPACIANQA